MVDFNLNVAINLRIYGQTISSGRRTSLIKEHLLSN